MYPGCNGAAQPFGSCTARRLHTVSEWANGADKRFDYGAIRLNCNVGNTTGWFGFFTQSASLNGLTETISGYPGDKPLTQWRSTDRIRVTQANQVFYLNDTIGGMSGSPVYTNRAGGGVCAMAIHAYGFPHATGPHTTHNHGTRITQAVFNNLVAWRNAP
jgi:glutamyl endopeptidase